MKVYISGKISGKTPAQAEADFGYYEQMVRDFGHEPINPMKNGLPFDAPWEDHMQQDLRLLKGCQAIYMMPDWVTSCGAQIELQRAFSADILILNDTNIAQCLMQNAHEAMQTPGRSRTLRDAEKLLNPTSAAANSKTEGHEV